MTYKTGSSITPKAQEKVEVYVEAASILINTQPDKIYDSNRPCFEQYTVSLTAIDGEIYCSHGHEFYAYTTIHSLHALLMP